MRVVFICQAVDLDDPVSATTVPWIRSMAADPRVDRLDVLALRVGRHNLPASVKVRRFGRRNRLLTLIAFANAVGACLRDAKPTSFFIYQGGAYPVLLLPLRILGIGIYQWKAHPHLDVWSYLSVHVCARRIFTSTPNAFPVHSAKVCVVGQGVDVDAFAPVPGPNERSGIVSVGRVGPVKRIGLLVDAIAICRDELGANYTLDVYGPVLDQDLGYKARLEAQVADRGLANQIAFRGPVTQASLPEILQRYRLFASASATALDRSNVEAMACELAVVSTNAQLAEILPHDLARRLIAEGDAAEDIANKAHAILASTDNDRRELGRRLREIVVRDHSVDGLMRRILDEMAATGSEPASGTR